MLRKSEDLDACEQALAGWRAMIPHWNEEADRYRSVALAASRTRTAPEGVIDEIDALQWHVRYALADCEALIADTLPGDPRLNVLVSAAANFEALLQSLHGSRERIEDHAGYTPARKPPVIIRPKLEDNSPANRSSRREPSQNMTVGS